MNNLAKAIQTNTSRRNRRCLIDQIDSLEHSLMMMLNRKGKSRKDMHGMPEELKEKFLTFLGDNIIQKPIQNISFVQGPEN